MAVDLTIRRTARMAFRVEMQSAPAAGDDFGIGRILMLLAKIAEG